MAPAPPPSPPSPLLLSLYTLLYPTPTPTPTPSTQPQPQSPQILCLGLSRSGTESLSQALQILHLSPTYHGFSLAQHPGHPSLWVRLAFHKQRLLLRGQSTTANNVEEFSIQTFNTLLSPCAAVTDLPCAYFAPELLAAYPTAKVILNRRADARAWARSIENTLGRQSRDWGRWWRSWWDAEAFWLMWCYRAVAGPAVGLGEWGGVGRGAGEEEERRLERGVEVYERHYKELESILERQGRGFLRWEVGEGWERLCQFLNKPVPDQPFPSGNNPEQFVASLQRIHAAQEYRIWRNQIIVGSVLVGVMSYVVWKMVLAIAE